MDTGTIITIVVAAVIVVTVFAVLVSLRIRVARAAKRSRQESASRQKEQQSIVWAGALIVDSRGGAAGESADKARLTLTLEVTPPEGTPYRASAIWLVDMSAMHLAAPGSHVPVKLVSADPQKIYPAVPWASYVGL
jgi:hypothetical protein